MKKNEKKKKMLFSFLSFLVLYRCKQFLKIYKTKNNFPSSILCMKMSMVKLIMCKPFNAERAVFLSYHLYSNEFFHLVWYNETWDDSLYIS